MEADDTNVPVATSGKPQSSLESPSSGKKRGLARKKGMPAPVEPELERVRALARVAETVAGSTDVKAIARIVVNEAARMCDTAMALVYLYNDEGDLQQSAGFGLSPRFIREIEKLGRAELAGNDSGGGDSFLVGPNRPVEIGAGPGSEARSPLHALAAAEGITKIVSVPFRHGEKALGVMMLYHDGERKYDPYMLEVLSVMASCTSLALAHARLHETRKWEQKAQDHFLDVLSHELRTPLTSIMGFAQIIRRRFNQAREVDTRLRDQLDLLWAQAQRLNRLLDTFMDISTIERGGLTIEQSRVDVPSILQAAIEQSRSQARIGHEVQVDIPDEPVWIQGDARRLEHVFSHVISNAIKYSPHEEPITVRCKRDDAAKEVVVSVIDHGPGISAELRREIFKRFYPSETRKAGGMGIGLYASRAIVEAHGGHLTLEGSPGHGTTVNITLPM